MSILDEYEKAENVKEIFEVVKETIRTTLKETRAGLDLGLMDLGNTPDGLLSAYYPVGSNVIVLNKTPLKRIAQTQPELLKPYVFVVLLHEYIHSLGYLDEETTRKMTRAITEKVFSGSIVTDMAKDMTKYFPFLLYPGGHPSGDKMDLIELDEIDYIG